MTTTQRSLSWIAAFAVFICAVLLFESILLPFLVGLAVAYFLDPVCDRLEQMGCSRTIATSLVTASFFLLVILLFAILVPVLYKQLVQFAAQLPDLAARIEAKARPLTLRALLPLTALATKGRRKRARGPRARGRAVTFSI